MKKTGFEAVVIGLGPAGMAAAVELARAGVRTAVIDDNIAPGGQVYRQPPAEFGPGGEEVTGPRHRAGRRLLESFNRHSSELRVLEQSLVWGPCGSSGLSLIKDGRPMEIGFEELILCEGARERVLPFPGWTLPGIMTTGGLQKMVTGQRVLPGRRVLLSGSGPLQLSVAASLVWAGAEIAGLCEAVTARTGWRLIPALLGQSLVAREALSCLAQLRRGGVAIRRPRAIISAAGEGRVEEARTARLDSDWRPIPGTEEVHGVDVVGLGFGFQPSARLTRLMGCDHVYDAAQWALRPETDRMMKTSRGNIHAAGDGVGIGGADMAEVEGRLAGVDAALALGRLSKWAAARKTDRLLRKKRGINRYSAALNSVFRPRPGYFSVIDRQTVICRCEGVTAGRLWDEMESGCRTLVDLKPCRIAMGPCQGRMCESIVTELVRLTGARPDEIGHLHLRPPVSPLPISAFMADESAPGL